MKIKLFLSLLFAFSISTKILAQEKYEYATIMYHPSYKVLSVSISGQELIKEKINIPNLQSTYENSIALLEKVNEFQEKGYEVMSFEVGSKTLGMSNDVSIVFYAFLKKKKQ